MSRRGRGPRRAHGPATLAAVAVLLGPVGTLGLAACSAGGDDVPSSGASSEPAPVEGTASATGSDTLPEFEHLNTLETPRDDFGTSVVGDEIWVMGGMTGERGTRLTSIEVLDTRTGEWRTEDTQMPRGLASFETVAIGSDIYLVGGFDAEFRATDFAGVLDTRTGRWRALPPLPHARYAHTVTLYDGRIHVVGGRDADGAVEQVDVLDPATDTWSTAAAPMPGARDSHRTLATEDGLLVLGGFTGEGATDRVDLFDPATGERSEVPPLPRPISRGGAAVADGRAWVSWHEATYVLDLADPAAGWAEGNPLTLSRHGLGYVPVGGWLYAIAGCSENPLRDVRTVDRMRLP